MKAKILTSLVTVVITALIMLLPSCRNRNEVIINGTVPGSFAGKIEYTDPVNGVCNWWFTDSVTPDSSGMFMISIRADGPLFIKLRTSYDRQGTLVAEPGKTYRVRLDPAGPEKFLTVEDNSAMLQDAFNSLPFPEHIQVGAAEFLGDTSALLIRDTIDRRKQQEMAVFEKMLADKIISRKAFDLINTDRNCYYDALFTTVAWIKYNMSVHGMKDAFTPWFDTLWKEAFSQPLFSDDAIVRSPWFSFYTESYIYYREYLSGNFTKEKIEGRDPATLRSYRVARAREYLPATLCEDYLADYLYSEAFQRNYESELTGLLDDFMTAYPGSGYIPHLSPMAEEIAAFYRKVGEGPGKGVIFIDDRGSLSSLGEATANLPEGLVYVDVWATWCGPCKSEFQHTEALKDLLAGKGVTMLYISIDRDQDSVKWKNMVSYYDLSGYHMRAGKDMVATLRELYGMNGMIAIPWNMIVDNQGKILLKRASPPSAITTLEEEIDTRLTP